MRTIANCVSDHMCGTCIGIARSFRYPQVSTDTMGRQIKMWREVGSRWGASTYGLNSHQSFERNYLSKGDLATI